MFGCSQAIVRSLFRPTNEKENGWSDPVLLTVTGTTSDHTHDHNDSLVLDVSPIRDEGQNRDQNREGNGDRNGVKRQKRVTNRFRGTVKNRLENPCGTRRPATEQCRILGWRVFVPFASTLSFGC